MSAGAFTTSTYQGDTTTQLYPIRIQPETAELVLDGTSNAPIGTPPNSPVSARARGGRRLFGVNARTVTVKFTGAVPTGYKPGSTIALPVLTPSLYSTINKGMVGEYLGLPIEVVGKKPEYIN